VNGTNGLSEFIKDIFCGSKFQFMARPPHYWGFKITHTHTHTHTITLLWTSNRLVEEAATYTTHNKHKRRAWMSSAGFEPAIPQIERPQHYALKRAPAGIGWLQTTM